VEGGERTVHDIAISPRNTLRPNTVIASAAKQSMAQQADRWIASLRSQ
jgi:hypothetical protein